MKPKKVHRHRPQKKERVAATLVIRHPGAMTEAGRRQVAGWLHSQSLDLVKDGAQYSRAKFSARLYVR